MSLLPTVRVVSPESPDGYMVINESDFVEGEHERFEDAAADAPADEPKSAAPKGRPALGLKRK